MFKNYPEDALERLEIDKVIELVSALCYSNVSAQAFRDAPYYTNLETLDHQLKLVDTSKVAIEKGESLPLSSFGQLDLIFKMLTKEGYSLSLNDLYLISKIVWIISDVYNFFSEERKETYPLLWQAINHLTPPKQLFVYLDRIIDGEGEIKPTASEQLVEIVQSQLNCQKALDKAFQKELNKYKKRDWLTDNFESIRNGRRVLSVKSEKKRQLKGIIHDESSTGKTTFIEPFETVEYHNQLQEISIAYEREILKILTDTSNYLRLNLLDLEMYYASCIQLDILQAKGQFSAQINAYKPRLENKPTFEINNGFHPLLDLKLRKESKKVVPFNVYLNHKNRILLLSGPNAGGKSVTLKAIGLMQVMLQKALLLPLDPSSKMSLFNQVFVDIGDQQSMEEDLSTYSSHLVNMNHFIRKSNDKTLLLIDEFGSGTDPQIGGALAESILYALNRKKCFGIITTHYSNLKIFAFHTKGIVNAAMSFDKQALSPSYQLKVGQPGSSFAYEIAKKSGIPDQVIHAAKKKTGKSQTRVEDLLVSLQQDKAQLESQIEEGSKKDRILQRLINQYDQLKQDLDIQKKKFKLSQKEFKLQQLAIENKALNEYIAQLKTENNIEKVKEKIKSNKTQRTAVSEDLKNDIKTIYYQNIDNISPISVGDYVVMKSGGFEGEVVEIKNNIARLMMGGMKIDIPLFDLIKKGVPLQNKSDTRTKMDIIKPELNFDSKLDIRGVKAIEANGILRAYLDQALINGINMVTILHGKGNGILRKTVKEISKEYSAIKQTSHPSDEHGGNGITYIKFE